MEEQREDHSHKETFRQKSRKNAEWENLHSVQLFWEASAFIDQQQPITTFVSADVRYTDGHNNQIKRTPYLAWDDTQFYLESFDQLKSGREDKTKGRVKKGNMA